MSNEFLDGNDIKAEIKTDVTNDTLETEQKEVLPTLNAKNEAPEVAPAGEAIPEKYNLKMQEGFELNEKIMEKYVPVAKELGFSNEKAQKIADLFMEIKKEEIQAQKEAYEKLQTNYIEQAKNDKEFGGKDFEANLAVANTAINKFGGSELAKVLAETGVANHPEFIRFFYRIGKAVSEDSVVSGAGSATSPKSAAEVIFDKSLIKKEI